MVKHYISGAVARWSRVIRNEQLVLSILAFVVGVVAAYAAIGFRLGIEFVQSLGFGFWGEHVYTEAAKLPWWRVVLVPVFGGLLVGLGLQFLAPGHRLQGVAQVIESMRVKAGYMRLKKALVSALLNITALGTGASAGREGPMVHLGAALASTVAHRLHLGPGLGRTILACGVASAVAASFNAPIAGVFFALEVIAGQYAMSIFAPVVIAAVAGTIVTRIHLGEQLTFVIPDHAISSFWEIPAYMILGIVCAAIAVALVKSIFFAEDMAAKYKIPIWVRPAAAGLVIGILAIEFPHILGVGYQATNHALHELFPLWMLIVLIAVKTFATAICIGARFGGGIFSPALLIGALTGGAYGLIAAKVFPELAAGHGAYSIVGMSAFAGAVLGAPISTIFIVFELTGDYQMTIATMIATSVASVIAQQLLGGSFFTNQLERMGVDLRSARQRAVGASRTVRDIMTQEFVSISGDAKISEIVELCRGRRDWHICVVDDGRLVGAFSFIKLRDIVLDQGELDPNSRARDLVGAGVPFLTLDLEIINAIDRLEDTATDYLPVVDPLLNDKLLGIVQYKHAMRAHDDFLRSVEASQTM